LIVRLPDFDRLPENPPAPRRPDADEAPRPDVFANELHRASTPPPARRPEPVRPDEPETNEPQKTAPRSAKTPPRKPRHDDHDPPPQTPTQTATPTAPAPAPATATVTPTATATATVTAAVAATDATTPSPPAAEPTEAAASTLLEVANAIPDSPTAPAAPSAASAPSAPSATAKPDNPLAAAIDDAQQVSVTIALSGGGGSAAPNTSSNGASPDGNGGSSSGNHAADALLSMRLGTLVRPIVRAGGLARIDGDATSLLAAPRSELHAAPPRVALPTLPIERPDQTEPTDPAAQPGHHRADLTVGDGDQKIVVSVMASEHQVRVHARAVTVDETAALRAGVDELRGSLKKQGLELAYLGAETMGGRASQEQGPGRGPQRDTAETRGTPSSMTPEDSEETARPDVRVLA
jgi:hypothetical protein